MKPLVVILILLAVLAGWLLRMRGGRPDPRLRLKRHVEARSTLTAYVKFTKRPRQWDRVARLQGEVVIGESQQAVLDEVRAFVVAYPSGEILDSWGPIEPVPDATHWAETGSAVEHTLRRSDLAAGERLVSVTFGPSASRPDEPGYYSTTVTNISEAPLRVTRFGGYVPEGRSWKLNTITEGYFTAEQFVEWYAAPGDGWLPPGASVTDPSNYGSPPVLWAFEVETDGGEPPVWVGGAIR